MEAFFGTVGEAITHWMRNFDAEHPEATEAERTDAFVAVASAAAVPAGSKLEDE